MRISRAFRFTCLGALLATVLPAAQGVYVTGDGVGIDTETPTEALHVFGDAGEVQLLVEETNGTTARRTLLSMENNGQVAMQYTDHSLDNVWLFATRGTGFEINKAGTGLTEFLMRANGNLEITGTLSQGSSRAWKHKIAPVEGDEILDRVMELPILSWQYDREGADGFHLGPMAEDFHAAFELGADAQHLAPGDVAGVALAAIQQLKSLRDEQIASLEAQNLELRAELDELTKLVNGLGNGASAATE